MWLPFDTERLLSTMRVIFDQFRLLYRQFLFSSYFNWNSLLELLRRALKNPKYHDIAKEGLKFLIPENSIRWRVENYNPVQCLYEIIKIVFDDLSAAGLESAYDILVSAVALSVVYQYLVGYVDKGGAKTFNPGSLEFRATYVSVLLFLAAYVWIKFRDVANRKVSRRHKVDGSGNRVPSGKWLPLFKPRREKDRATGASLQFQCLRLGGYSTHQDAKVVCQIAGFYYWEDEGRVELEDGFRYDIPPMSEHEWGLSGMPKWYWASDKAKEVFRLFQQAYDAWRATPPEGNVVQTQQDAGNVNDPHDPTLLQPSLDVADFVEAASNSGIEVAQIGSDATDYCFQVPETLSSREIQNAKSASTPNIAASAANASVGNPQSLCDCWTPIPDETRSTGGTVEAGLMCGINDLGDGQEDGRAILFGDNVVQNQQGHVNGLHDPTVSQPPSLDAAEFLKELLKPTTTQAQPTWDGIEFPDISDEAVRLPESSEDEGTILDYTTTLWNH